MKAIGDIIERTILMAWLVPIAVLALGLIIYKIIAHYHIREEDDYWNDEFGDR